MNLNKALKELKKDVLSVPKKAAKKVKDMGSFKFILMCLPYLLFAYLGNKCAYVFRISDGSDMSAKFTNIVAGLGGMFRNPLPSFHPADLLWGFIICIAMRFLVYYKTKNAKKYRKGVEYGSARWGNEKDIAPYMDTDNFRNNIILTQSERLQLTGKPLSPQFARNKNVLVIGGSGSGKTRFFIKPNLMQMHSSYVVTDPKGYI